ncbi:ATP-binding protein [Sphaerisporangium aureirubrum]|uniref:ATP-binding protein n=1 Tax=Sphaerisporangium aureirubrum TaxID=1544736 RepID=A0ABW1NLZ0_9ACTN
MATVQLLGDFTFPGVVAEVPPARRAVRRAAARHLQVPDTTEHPALEVVELLTCEVITNALRHTVSGLDGGEVRVRLLATVETFRVEVLDQGAIGSIPEICVPDPMSECGRGMFLVEALSKEWGATRNRTGTRTWFEVPF